MKPFIYLVLIALSLLSVTGCSDTAPKLTKGQSVPGFVLEHLEGKPLRFPEDLKDNVVAIRFWADWCPFCESEMQNLEPVYQAYRDRDLIILAVNVRQARDTAETFIRKLDISYDVLLDKEGEVARQYGVIGLPTTFIVDRQGRLYSRILGESTPEVFEAIIRELL